MDAQMAIAYALLETIKEAGSMGAPSGPMYMAVQMKTSMSLDDYQSMMRALVRTGLVEHKAHVYYWIGEK